jgi:hypothetical protein
MNNSPADDGAAENAAEGDVFMHEQWRGLEKRTRSSTHAAAAAAGGLVMSPGAQRLPVLSELCLFKCHVSWEALEQLVVAAGIQLQKLQLLQVYTNSAAAVNSQQGLQSTAARVTAAGTPAAAVADNSALAAAVNPRTAAARAARTSAIPAHTAAWVAPAEMTTQQLMALPVAWDHLQEWTLHPHQLWGLVRAGCFASDAGSAVAGAAAAEDGSSSSSSSGSITQQHQHNQQQQQQQRRRQLDPSGYALQHASQLLNLRHLYVVNRPAAFGAAFPSVKEHRPGESVTCLPLHHRPSMEALLAQLQAGLQQLPALRQLLLYLGHVARERPDLCDACADATWTDAGEQLLEVMPACRVKHYKPSIVAVGGGETAGLVPVALEEGAAAGGGGGVAAGGDGGGDGMEYVI